MFFFMKKANNKAQYNLLMHSANSIKTTTDLLPKVLQNNLRCSRP